MNEQELSCTCILVLPNIDPSKLCGDCEELAEWWVTGGNAFYNRATETQYSCTKCLGSCLSTFEIEDNSILELVNNYTEREAK